MHKNTFFGKNRKKYTKSSAKDLQRLRKEVYNYAKYMNITGKRYD